MAAAETETKNIVEFETKTHFFTFLVCKHILSHHLRIPPAFNQHLRNETIGKITLKGPSGNIWHIELVSRSKEFYFEDGWDKFVNDHSIVVGDFLVFRYDGCSQFSMKVFSPNACEKEYAFVGFPSHKIAIANKEHGNGVNTIAIGNIEMSVLPLGESVGTHVKKTRGMEDYQKCCDSSTENASFGSPKLITPTCDGNREELGRCVNNLVPFLFSYVQNSEGYITEWEKYKTLERANEFTSEKPFFLLNMNASYVRVGLYLNIPRKIAREYLPKIDSNITLWNSDGHHWVVNYHFSRNRNITTFNGGWSRFVSDNHLKEYDVCIFELIQKTQLNVHIYRAAPELPRATMDS